MEAKEIRNLQEAYLSVYAERETYLSEEVEIATEYFYEMGLDEDGIYDLIEEVGLDEFVGLVYDIADEYVLSEARAGGARIEPVTATGKPFKGGKPTKKGLERLRAQKAARREAESKASASKPSGLTSALKSQSATASASKPTKKSEPEKTKKGIGAAIGSALKAAGERARQDTELLKKSWQTASDTKLAQRARIAAKKGARAVEKHGASVGAAAGKAVGTAAAATYRAGKQLGSTERGKAVKKNLATAAKKVIYKEDIILSHLIGEGYAESIEDAEVIMINMSEDWRENILNEARKKVKIHTDKPIEYKIADIGPGKKEYNVKTSKGWKEEYELNEGPYDAEVMGRSQIRKTGEGGRIGATRKKSTPERRRMRAVGGGKMEPVEYKPRKDIGSQRQRSDREQAPTQERGSADVRARAAAAAKEERRKAAQARIAAKKGGAAPTQEKPKAKEVEKQASELLRTKKPEKPVRPDYTPPKASGYTAKERMSITRKGETKLRGIMKDQEVEKYKQATGQNPTGKALTKVLARVHQRMST